MLVGVGVKRTGDWTSRFAHNLDTSGFLKRTQELFDKEGFRLLYFITYTDGGQLRWAGVYRSGNWAHRLIVDMDKSTFVKTTQTLFDKEGLRLESMSTYVVNGQRRWAGSYRSGDWGHRLHLDRTQPVFLDESNKLHAEQGLRLSNVRTYVDGGQRLWAGIYRSGNWANRLLVDRTFSAFATDTQKLLNEEGLRLVDVTTYVVSGQRRWAAVYRSGDWGSRWFFALNRQHFTAVNQQLFNDQGLRLIALSYHDQQVPTVRLHLKILSQPTIPIDTMLANMRTVYAGVGIGVEVATTETLNLPVLNDLDVGSLSTVTTEESQLWATRNNVGTNEIPVWFVRTAGGLFGEAGFVNGQPGCVVASTATNWTLAHEVGHVLGLPHADDTGPRLTDRLMTGGGTNTITNPPPDLASGEVTTMLTSALTIDL